MLKISLIIPIYNALDDVKLCINSLYKNFNFNIGEIILVNDYSDKDTTDFLRNFSTKNNKIQLIENEENLGFVKTCNKGMRIAKGEIIVLLNSDTIVPKCFTKKIIKCFESDAKIGLASPVRTKGGYYGIDVPENYSLEKINKLLEKKHTCSYPLIPSAEGLCFCIRRAVIEKQGYLDEVWGKGYHEEIDYAYRAITNGWKNVLIDNLFIYHKKHASFGEETRLQLMQQNDPEFYRRWSGFREKYIEDNKIDNPVIDIQREIFSQCEYKFIEKIFSVKNDKDRLHKVICFMGIKFSFKINKRK